MFDIRKYFQASPIFVCIAKVDLTVYLIGHLFLMTNIRPAMKYKDPSLFCDNNSKEKKFYNNDTWSLYYKTFYGRNLRTFVKSYSFCPWQAFPA